MLKNDVFLLYPPGYSGNYLQWIINVSERDSAARTVQDPLLPDGTTHGFVRRPTHLGLMRLLQWMLKNNPEKPQTYIVNAFQHPTSWHMHSAYGAFFMLHARPNCAVVNIYADTDDEIKHGALNTYTKWPTFFDSTVYFGDYGFDLWGSDKPATIKDRNHLYDSWKKDFPINPNSNFWEEFDYNTEANRLWYESRNKLQPWEINETEYTTCDSIAKERILNIRLTDILKDRFLEDIFVPWVDSQHIGEFDWTHALSYHLTYVAAQKNIIWFEAIKQFRQLQIVDKFLLSNSLVQAFVLEELGDRLQALPDWRDQSIEEILQQFNYQIKI